MLAAALRTAAGEDLRAAYGRRGRDTHGLGRGAVPTGLMPRAGVTSGIGSDEALTAEASGKGRRCGAMGSGEDGAAAGCCAGVVAGNRVTTGGYAAGRDPDACDGNGGGTR